MKRIFLLFAFIICFHLLLYPQIKIRKFTLEEVIELAKQQSPDALSSKNRFLSSYWAYNTYKAQYLPVLALDATLPSLNRSIQKYPLSDGTDTYVKKNYIDDWMNLTLKKTVGTTGGQLFMNSYLQRSDNFVNDKSAYLTSPIVIGFSQPLSSYNYHNWAKKIEPLKFEEAKKRYCEETEDIAIKATNMFFNLLLAQMNISIAEQNLSNNDTLYKIAEKRFEFGKIAENELLQIQLGQLNSNNELEQAKINFEVQLLSFKSFLGIKDFDKVELIAPVEVYDIEVNVQKALAEAKLNRSDAIAFERSLLEAKSYLKSTQSQSKFSANLYCNFGLTQNAGIISDAYSNPLDQETVTLGIHVPLLDWGLSKGRVKMAEANQQLVQTIIDQQKIDFEQNIFLKVMMFNNLCNQLFVSSKADTVSRKRYNVTKDRYLIGKIGITEVNIALSDQNNAKRNYISSLRTYWAIFHELRRLTLYDFINNEPIKFDFSKFEL